MGGIDRVITTKEPKIGIRQAIRWINKKVLRRNVVDPLDKLAEDIGSASYERTVRKMIERLDELEPATVNIDGKAISEATPELFKAPTSASKINIDNVFDLTKNPNLGEKAADDEFKALLSAWYNIDDPLVKTTVWQRAGQLVKGYTGLPAKVDKIPTWKRQVVMASSILLSYAYMMEESKADKYHVSQNSVVLSWPPMYTFLMKNPTDPASNNYETVKLPDLKSNTWVQMKIPGVFTEGGMPLYLASPCKADVTVKGGQTCKCAQYVPNDKLLVTYKIAKCAGYTGGTGCAIPNTLDKDGKPIDSSKNPCISGTLALSEETIFYDVSGKKEKTVWDPFIALDGSKKCFVMEKGLPVPKDILNGDGKCELEIEKTMENAYFDIQNEMVSRCAYSYVVLNSGPAREGGTAAYKTCTKEGWLDFLETAPATTNRPCIQISVDSTSMSNYATAGFKPNFCRINEGDADDMAVVGIDAGIAIGSVALTLFPPTSALGAATVPVVLGASGGVGSVITKYIDITSKWPEDQF